MQISDIITNMILQMLEDSEQNTAEIQRNVLAGELGCVPSQINYVLSSRFTPEQGYIIESRRGGGGFIRIRRVHVDRSSAIMHIINSIGAEIDAMAARVVVQNMQSSGLIDDNTANIFLAVISSNALRRVAPDERAFVRSDILKQLLLTQIGRNDL